MKKKPVILMLTCFHGRPKISALFLKSFFYMKACLPQFDFIFHAAVTEGDTENIELLKEANLPFVETQNRPLGRKWNEALFAMRREKWDYILIAGSDDLIAPELILTYQPYIADRVPFLAVQDLFFLDSETQRAAYFSYPGFSKRSVGAGRLISRRAVAAVGGDLWTDYKQSSLDMDCDERLANAGIRPAIVPLHRGMIVDVKSPGNIWPYERFTRLDGAIEVTAQDALWWCPNDLWDAIYAVCEGDMNNVS